MKSKIVLGLSGGVDSAVAARLLRDRGYEVHSVYLDNGVGDPAPARETAAALIGQVETFAAKHLEEQGTRLVWCSDEFYLLAGRELPPEDYFEDFTQLDNGVGMLTLLSKEFGRALDLMERSELEGTTPFSARTAVRPAAKAAMQGWVYRVWDSRSSGPSKQSCFRSKSG